MLSFEDNGFVVEYLFLLYVKCLVFVAIFPCMSEYADMQILEIVFFEIMLFEDFVPEKIMLAAIENVEFRIFVILKSFMPVDMVGIDVQEHADIIIFLESFEHIA